MCQLYEQPAASRVTAKAKATNEEPKTAQRTVRRTRKATESREVDEDEVVQVAPAVARKARTKTVPPTATAAPKRPPSRSAGAVKPAAASATRAGTSKVVAMDVDVDIDRDEDPLDSIDRSKLLEEEPVASRVRRGTRGKAAQNEGAARSGTDSVV